MRQAGFDYADPMKANNDPAFQTPAPTEREIATAVADVQCKARTGLVDVWASVETAYQQRALDEHAEELTVIHRWLSIQTANARRILGAT